MKRFGFIGITLLFSLLFAGRSNAQNDPWSEYMNPSEVHSFLQKFEGEWSQEVSIWMDTKQPPQKFNLNCSNKMILGGRFLESTTKGDMGGMAFEGISVLSFNTISKQFQLTAINNIGTGTLAMEGTWKDSLKIVTLNGEMTDPVTGKKLNVKQVLTFSKDEYLIENYDQKDNSPAVKSMEYRFTRK